ncbi:MAG: divalent-cation tolerance protein CutA [Nitrospiraceae bacterium]|nr:divalent-cation tolerance protein CutA [Nitrospiraceae bacterium]
MKDEYIVVLVAASSEDEGAAIAKVLVSETLAGCVNIVKGVRSIYSWQGRVEDEQEVLLIAKTRRELFEKLAEKVRELHSYEVPEIISVPVEEGSEAYLNWLTNATRIKAAPKHG